MWGRGLGSGSTDRIGVINSGMYMSPFDVSDGLHKDN